MEVRVIPAVEAGILGLVTCLKVIGLFTHQIDPRGVEPLLGLSMRTATWLAVAVEGFLILLLLQRRFSRLGLLITAWWAFLLFFFGYLYGRLICLVLVWEGQRD